MIKKECFTAEWIEQVSSELHYNDKNLIEKVIRALSLLEMLVKAGCPLVFKGGTALMLILGKSAHRLSIDIDLICPPGTNIEDCLKSFADFGFINLNLWNASNGMMRIFPRAIPSFSIRLHTEMTPMHNPISCWMYSTRTFIISVPNK